MIGAMQRWTGPEQVPPDWPHSVVCIGVFDGVHRGHQAILARAGEAALQLSSRVVVVTFDPHPNVVVRPEVAPLMLSTLQHRLELLADEGVAATLVLRFGRELSLQPPEQFVRELLAGTLHACRVVVGENFRFGHRALGDAELLRAMGDELGFETDAVSLVDDGGEPVSSTRIRALLAAGEVAAAAEELGRPHRVEGVVVRGDGRGRQLGFPTANVDAPTGFAVPDDGVYAGWLVRRRDARHLAAISVGTNPTFDGRSRRVEAFALDGDPDSPAWDLYGEHVAVEFAERLRGMVRFDGVPALVEQMGLDVARTRELLEPEGSAEIGQSP
jgi:riboflavin kinase/FMN adenylyltransferase